MHHRLDQAMVVRGLVRSRSRAQDLIRRGCVTVDGHIAAKTGLLVSQDAQIHIAANAAADMVSRGALKLAAALDVFGFDPRRQIAIDVGASTGGFTEVLLARGAAKVYAVDVGRGQLDPLLGADPRVVSLEQTDARALDAGMVPDPIGAIVADVSFISLVKALPAAMDRAASGAWLVALVKPQFEVGRDGIGKGGIVRDEQLREAALAGVAAWIAEQPGWRVTGSMASPITGRSGNVEWLIGARRDDRND